MVHLPIGFFFFFFMALLVIRLLHNLTVSWPTWTVPAGPLSWVYSSEILTGSTGGRRLVTGSYSQDCWGARKKEKGRSGKWACPLQEAMVWWPAAGQLCVLAGMCLETTSCTKDIAIPAESKHKLILKQANHYFNLHRARTYHLCFDQVIYQTDLNATMRILCVKHQTKFPMLLMFISCQSELRLYILL